jgi:hypothetical protein
MPQPQQIPMPQVEQLLPLIQTHQLPMPPQVEQLLPLIQTHQLVVPRSDWDTMTARLL